MSYYRGPQGTSVTLSFPPVTPGVRILLWILGVAFGIQFVLQTILRADGILGYLALWPPMLLQAPYPFWTLVTYALLHGGIMHLLLNMLGLWMFGGDVERMLGTPRFLRFFVGCVAGGGLLYAAVGLLRGIASPVIGASAGVLGVSAAFAVFFPNRQLFVFPLPFPISAKIFVIVFAAVTVFSSVAPNPGDLTAHLAHLGGLAVGALLAWLFKRRLSGGGAGGFGGWPGGGARDGARPPFRVVRGDRDDDRWTN
jgi:membrane associated rhomboid family serine protease